MKEPYWNIRPQDLRTAGPFGDRICSDPVYILFSLGTKSKKFGTVHCHIKTSGLHLGVKVSCHVTGLWSR